jgi:hydrogenase-4 transcriptional activator
MQEHLQHVLLNVWQEACRHIEIGQSTANIAAMLALHLPAEQVLVRRIDRAKSGLETVAVGLAGLKHRLGDARIDCSPAQLKTMLDWCRRGKVAQRGGDCPNFCLSKNGTVPFGGVRPAMAEFFGVVAGPHQGDVLAGPLGDPAGNCGVLVFLAPKGSDFGPKHADLVQLLLEPFSVALENDLRLREMNALREAAEADKRSLLTKLGRKTLGDTIVGVESGLHAIMERVELVAPSDAPVLIFGETGTGKELIARAIHNRSSRRNGPFDRVNCGAIPPELIDSQLFGHERGAFTGAVEARRGWFERADGGTLFLDEIGDLPAAAQVRMLRILQDGWMERVGAEKPINVDVRIIAATHRDLASMVAQGRFRQDLWYRIAVFPMVLPPLRERREDIAGLAVHFAERAATRFGLAPATPTSDDLSLLAAYFWPGNVRELAAVIDRAAILGDGKRLDVATALGVNGVSPAALPAAAHSTASPRHSAAVIEPLNVAVRRHIESALAITHGRIEGRQGAAALLEINPHTLRAKMRKLGIDWSRFRESP